MPTNEILERYNAKANTIIDHYEALTKVVAETLFPWKFVALSTLPDTANWSEKRKAVMIIIMPLSLFDHFFDRPDGNFLLRVFSFMLWLIIYGFYNALGMASLIVISQVSNGTRSTSDQTSTMSDFTVWFLIILFIAIALLIHWQVIWYLFNGKTSWKNRFIWIGTFLMVAYLSYLEIIDTVPNLSMLVASNDPVRILLWFAVTIFWVPTIMITSSLILIFGKLILYAIFSTLIYFTRANSPNYSFLVKSILPKVIGGSNNTSIFSLSISEIVALKEWARINLDTTEKRTVPAIILLAILGAVAAFSRLQDFLYSVLTAFINLFQSVLDNFLKSPQGFVAYLVTFVATATTLLMFVLIVIVYVRLLSNLFVQSVVIEVCTVAEYAKGEVERELERAKKSTQQPWYFQILRWLFRRWTDG